jgi:Tfp pilus assembly protein PilP
MKTAMKLTTGILAMAVMAGAAWAQNTDAIDQARSIAKSLQQKQTNDTNAALDAAGVKAKPAPGAPAPAVKPAVIPGAKNAPATAAATKAAAPAATAAKNSAATAKSQTAAGKPADAAKKVAVVKGAPKVAAVKPAAPATAANSPKTQTGTAVPAAPAIDAAAAEASKIGDTAKPAKTEDKKWAMNGKRDPFFSPVVQQQGGSGCATGKKCLEIGNINLRGVVKSDSGFIAVVTNNLNKAYFLRENDPVFNGYVVRITGDSVVFQETVQDKLGKPFTREVVKRIFTPAV